MLGECDVVVICRMPNTVSLAAFAVSLSKKCEHIGASMVFQGIDPDGTVWVQFRGGNQGQSEWQECMRKAAQEQAAQQRLTR